MLERASQPLPADAEVVARPRTAAARICAPFALSQTEIDAEQRRRGGRSELRAHAEEAGGGDVFLFPKPVEPTAPYGAVSAPAGVALLDYEVELGVGAARRRRARGTAERDALLARSAFFVADEITDREPIIRHAALTGPGSGFVEAKGQQGFMPPGPWLVRGSELFAALAACGGRGLRSASRWTRAKGSSAPGRRTPS